MSGTRETATTLRGGSALRSMTGRVVFPLTSRTPSGSHHVPSLVEVLVLPRSLSYIRRIVHCLVSQSSLTSSFEPFCRVRQLVYLGEFYVCNIRGRGGRICLLVVAWKAATLAALIWYVGLPKASVDGRMMADGPAGAANR